MRRRYFAQQGDGVVVKHKTREAYRWLSLAEVRRIHAIPDTYFLDEEQSLTRAGEIIGQGVIVSFFQKIISAARHFPTSTLTITTEHQTNLSLRIDSEPTQTPSFAINQMGLAFT